jgi:glycosyltransferase involved in cell wall biosynthesis
MITGSATYLAGAFISAVNRLVSLTLTDHFFQPIHAVGYALVWYAGIPIVLGICLFLLSLPIQVLPRRKDLQLVEKPVSNENLTVVLTAYNDEVAVEFATRDFLSHPKVRRVVVVDNNSSDRTAEKAREAGAGVVHESRQGYGWCVFRALTEGVSFSDTDLTLLCEGDGTFRAYDIDKFLAYISHADVVAGTRISDRLQQTRTQVSTFIHYGNFFVGKLLEMRHFGLATISDVGTTYKLFRNDALRRLLPEIVPGKINLAYNPFLIDRALTLGLRLVEIPVTFHRRLGVSKGGNVNNFVALKLGMGMIASICTGIWPGSKFGERNIEAQRAAKATGSQETSI